MSTAGTIRKTFTAALLSAVLFMPVAVFAQESGPLPSPTGNPIPLEIPLGSETTEVNNLTEYLVAVYTFVVGAIGIIATVMIMFHGFGWTIAAGNAEEISKAKSGIISAIIGLILAYTSYSLLYIINPATVSFAGISVPGFSFPGAAFSTSAASSGEYIMSICSLDDQNLSSYPAAVGPCSGTYSSGSGGTMSAPEVAAAINRYKGNVSPVFLSSIIKKESGGCTNAYSSFTFSSGQEGHACGLTQFIPSTARTYAPGCSLTLPADDDPNAWSPADEEACDIIKMNPEKGICMMGALFNNLSARNDGHEVFMAAGYNAGQGSNRVSREAECNRQHLTQWQCPANNSWAIQPQNYVKKVDAFKRDLCSTLGGTITGERDGSVALEYLSPAPATTAGLEAL